MILYACPLNIVDLPSSAGIRQTISQIRESLARTEKRLRLRIRVATVRELSYVVQHAKILHLLCPCDPQTKRLILEVYDAMAEATASGKPYETILDPPPADSQLCHPESTRPDWAEQL